MPNGTELAPTADIGQNEDTTFDEPVAAPRAAVPGLFTYFKPSVAIKQCWVATVVFYPARRHHKIGHRCAVPALCKQLLHRHAAGVVPLRQLFQDLAFITASMTEHQCVRRQKVAVAYYILIPERVTVKRGIV